MLRRRAARGRAKDRGVMRRAALGVKTSNTIGTCAVGAVALGCALLAPAPALAADPPRLSDQHFTVDPVADGALIAGSAGFSGLLEMILSTGEITPQRPGSPDRLLGIDRVAVTQTFDPHASGVSNVGLGLALAFAAVDPFLSASRDGWDAALVDGLLYAETLSITLALTDIT